MNEHLQHMENLLIVNMTIEKVEKEGRHISCKEKCKMIGKQCPDIWCELHFIYIKNEFREPGR